MVRTTTRWKACAWLAALAVLFGVLAPTFASAFARADAGPAQVEICTVMGSRMVTLPGAPDERGPLHKTMHHCVCCTAHADTVGPPPAAAALVAVLDGHDAYPPLFYQSPQPLSVWIAAQSRGPPAA